MAYEIGHSTGGLKLRGELRTRADLHTIHAVHFYPYARIAQSKKGNLHSTLAHFLGPEDTKLLNNLHSSVHRNTS